MAKYEEKDKKARLAVGKVVGDNRASLAVEGEGGSQHEVN